MGVEETESLKLYIRLPVKVKEELEIKALHPNIVKVYLPRQKSRRWCVVEFENEDSLQEGTVALKKARINDKPIQIRPYFKKAKTQKRKSKKENPSTTRPLLKLLKKRNPFDQENDYYDSDWDVNIDEEWITTPQFVDVMNRTHLNLVLAAGTESSSDESDPNWQESNDGDTDEDYNPEYDYASETDMIDLVSDRYYYNDEYYDDGDDEELDYVTYPLEDPPAEADKPMVAESPNTRENSDTD